jgi:hypothetical protein
MQPLLKGLRKRWSPIHPVNDEDWMGMYFSVDCIPYIDMDDAAKAFGQTEESLESVAVPRDDRKQE